MFLLGAALIVGCARSPEPSGPTRPALLDFNTLEVQSSSVGELSLSDDRMHIKYHSEGRTTSYPVGEAPGLYREATVNKQDIEYTEPNRMPLKSATFRTVEQKRIRVSSDKATPVYQVIFATSRNKERVTVWQPRSLGRP